MKIDKAKRTIKDVSLITKGLTLNGGIVDDVTIEQMYELSKDGIACFLSHVEDPANRSPADAIAYITGIYKDGDSLRGHIQFLKAFVDNRKAEYETLIERAEIDPTSFGLSMSWFGKSETKEGKEHYRANIVCSADFVTTPAGVDAGLLSAQTEPVQSEAVKETIQPKQLYMRLTKEQYDKIKTDFPTHIDQAIQLSFDEAVMDVYGEIQKIVEQARVQGLYAENEALRAKVTELTALLAQAEADKASVESEKQSLSLKVADYEKRRGANPINTGLNSGEVLTLRQQLNLLRTNAERLAFYNKHKAELDAE